MRVFPNKVIRQLYVRGSVKTRYQHFAATPWKFVPWWKWTKSLRVAFDPVALKLKLLRLIAFPPSVRPFVKTEKLELERSVPFLNTSDSECDYISDTKTSPSRGYTLSVSPEKWKLIKRQFCSFVTLWKRMTICPKKKKFSPLLIPSEFIFAAWKQP